MATGPQGGRGGVDFARTDLARPESFTNMYAKHNIREKVVGNEEIYRLRWAYAVPNVPRCAPVGPLQRLANVLPFLSTRCQNTGITQDALRYSSSRSNRKFALLEIILLKQIHSDMKTSSRPRRAER